MHLYNLKTRCLLPLSVFYSKIPRSPVKWHSSLFERTVLHEIFLTFQSRKSLILAKKCCYYFFLIIFLHWKPPQLCSDGWISCLFFLLPQLLNSAHLLFITTLAWPLTLMIWSKLGKCSSMRFQTRSFKAPTVWWRSCKKVWPELQLPTLYPSVPHLAFSVDW